MAPGHQSIERALGGRGRGGDCSPGLQQVKPQPPFMAFWWVNHKQSYRQEACPIPPATRSSSSSAPHSCVSSARTTESQLRNQAPLP